MTNLMKYNAANLDQLLDRINRNSIGMDEYFDRLFTLHETTSNYPPYNLIQVSNVESRLELALAGFKKKQVNVYTQDGKLFVEGQREDGETGTEYVHRGLVLNIIEYRRREEHLAKSRLTPPFFFAKIAYAWRFNDRRT
jgi:molecular chaperone IbpA